MITRNQLADLHRLHRLRYGGPFARMMRDMMYAGIINATLLWVSYQKDQQCTVH
jgi:hypothetical protein